MLWFRWIYKYTPSFRQLPSTALRVRYLAKLSAEIGSGTCPVPTAKYLTYRKVVLEPEVTWPSSWSLVSRKPQRLCVNLWQVADCNLNYYHTLEYLCWELPLETLAFHALSQVHPLRCAALPYDIHWRRVPRIITQYMVMVIEIIFSKIFVCILYMYQIYSN